MAEFGRPGHLAPTLVLDSFVAARIAAAMGGI
jgi:hypothetical protein